MPALPGVGGRLNLVRPRQRHPRALKRGDQRRRHPPRPVNSNSRPLRQLTNMPQGILPTRHPSKHTIKQQATHKPEGRTPHRQRIEPRPRDPNRTASSRTEQGWQQPKLPGGGGSPTSTTSAADPDPAPDRATQPEQSRATDGGPTATRQPLQRHNSAKPRDSGRTDGGRTDGGRTERCTAA